METQASSSGRAGIILFAAGSRPDLGRTKRPTKWVLEDGRGTRLTTHLYLMKMLRMYGAIPPLPLHLNDVVLN
jgi:hypothetical protein